MSLCTHPNNAEVSQLLGLSLTSHMDKCAGGHIVLEELIKIHNNLTMTPRKKTTVIQTDFVETYKMEFT